MSDVIIAKNLLEYRTCDKCKFSFVKDDLNGPVLHCKHEYQLNDPYVKWKSHVVPKERTCEYWEEQ